MPQKSAQYQQPSVPVSACIANDPPMAIGGRCADVSQNAIIARANGVTTQTPSLVDPEHLNKRLPLEISRKPSAERLSIAIDNHRWVLRQSAVFLRVVARRFPLSYHAIG
jgi:hypothetical protein